MKASAQAAARNTTKATAGWKDSDGDRLEDFGVDEEIDFYDEDDIPLSELLKRRRVDSNQGSFT